MRTIAFMNQKGGVGKTTCAVNAGAALAARGQRVLLVDMDAQANLSLHLGIEVHRLERTVYTLLLGQSTARETALLDVRPGISVLPASIDLAGAEVELAGRIGRETVLRAALAPFLGEERFDFVLLDCPPSLGLLSLNALVAAREVFIPLQTEFFALQGMSRLLDVVELIRGRLGHTLEITGIIPTLYDSRTNLSREVVSEIARYFGKKVYKALIHSTVKLAECPSHGKTIFEYAPGSRGAKDFDKLAREILRRGPPGPPEGAAAVPGRAEAAAAASAPGAAGAAGAAEPAEGAEAAEPADAAAAVEAPHCPHAAERVPAQP
ncbi:MAG: ParA family protein [Planctomycetes bacterium]|nr:ParA family protein [Planctomycetota bacterium]